MEIEPTSNRCSYCGSALSKNLYFCAQCSTPHQNVENLILRELPDYVDSEMLIRQNKEAWHVFFVVLGALIDANTLKIETVNLILIGLQWAVGCPPKVQSALSKVAGISSATTTKTSATVVIDRNKVTNAQLVNAVRNAGNGYDATVQ